MKKLLFEDFYKDIEGYDDISNPDRMERVKQHKIGKYGIDAENLASSNYKQLIDKVKRYTGKPNISPFELQMMAMRDLQEVIGVEKRNKNYLEQLAVKTVLEMDDFAFIKDLVDSGDLVIDAKLVDMGSLNINLDNEENEEQEQEDPEVELSLAEIIMDEDEKKAKRALANAISQGMALNAQYVFHVLEDELARFSDKLVQQYGFLVSFGMLSYFAVPPGMEEMAKAMQAGEVNVDDEGGESAAYVIRAQGVIFPVLIQEIVKGIYQYLSLTNGLRGSDDSDLTDESDDIIVGPELTKKLRSFVDPSKVKYIPIVVQQMLINLDTEEITNVFKDPNTAKAFVADVIAGVDSGWEDDR